MVPEAPLEDTGGGFAPTGEGWFVVNAREAQWCDRGPRGHVCRFEGAGDLQFEQLGIHIFVLGPGEPMSMYHWEADQEDFLVLSGEALLIVEGEERPLRRGTSCTLPPGSTTSSSGRARGNRSSWRSARARGPRGGELGRLPLHEAAVRHDASAERETTDPQEAYARFPEARRIRYRGRLAAVSGVGEAPFAAASTAAVADGVRMVSY